ncbi:MAG: flippase-like domain-containing protein, partial [Tepidimonas sp.]|nr:flippase-like domain-containing protein [Tepidimonas sp.]
MSAVALRSAGVRRWLRLTVTLLLLGALLGWVGGAAVLDALRAADPVWVVVGLLAATLANAACAGRWRALADWLGHRVDGRWALWAYFRGQALNAVLPGATMGGDLWRVWALQRLGVPWSHASISVLLDRVIGLWALVWLGALAAALALTLLPSVAVWPWGTPPWPWAAVALLLALALWLVPLPLLRWGAQATWTDRPWGRWWRTLAQRQPQWQWPRQRRLALLAQ